MAKKGLFYKIKRWWYKMKYSPSSIDEMLYGKFRVKYPDGKVSVKMYYINAQSYASIFGGEIIEAF